MAQPDILLDLDMLKDNTLAATKAVNETIDAQMIEACNIVGTLTASGWTGVASQAFLNAFTEYKQQMRILYENIVSLQNALEGIETEGTTVFDNGARLLGTL